MKPNFALTLSFDGIGLLHRSDGGWLSVGDVPLDDPDLPGALKALVGKANTLDEGDITTKLVIPNQQIRYLHFESDSRDVDILEAQVRGTLNGATPYHVSELAYDWSMTDGKVCVAAVAIETLTEAESFAVDHGFSPLSFVAVPDEGAFQGEPFFGETVHAGDVLPPGDGVDRDEDAVVVIGQAALPKPEPDPVPEPLPDAETDAETAPNPDPDPAPVAGFQSARTAPPEIPSDVEDPTASESAISAPAQDIEPTAPAMSFASARKAPAPDAPDATDLPQGRLSAVTPDAAEPGMSADTPEEISHATSASEQEPGSASPADVAAETSEAAPEDLAAVAKARADTFKDPAADSETDAPIPARDAIPKAPDLPIRPTAAPSAPASNHPGRLAFLSQRKSDAPRPGPTAKDRAQAAAKASGAALSAGIKAKLGGKIGTGLGAGLGTGLTSSLKSGLTKSRGAAAQIAGAANNLRPKSAPPTAAQQTATRAFEAERQRMTVFGARNPDNASTENNPRFMALAVTAGLLFFLVGIAAWAAIFLDGGLSSLFRSSDDVQFAEDPAAIEAPEAVAPGSDASALPQDPEPNTEELADESLETLRPNDPISEELSPDEARARYAATGIWQMSPTVTRAPLTGQFEDVYQTSLDPDVNFSDAVALPQVSSLLPAARPTVPGNPLPPGSDDVARDARGFVLATPDGTVTPDRLITIFTGPPPLVPPATPGRAEPELVEVALVPEPVVTSQDAGLRPRARPSDVSDDFERVGNGGRTLDELQTIRPRLRPQSEQEQALAEAGVAPEIAEGGETLFEDATEEAVTASLKPRPRPANFARLVEQSRETAAAEPVSVEQRVSVDIPTTASVARAATERNQISLRRLNLIGVYGSDNNRRALVRLPNGRYQKVEVGDRLDGGQVAAIGDGELRYIKRGQSVLLKMPSS
ncbi:MAG: hypothetical protein AAF280_11265 [Pseudomonadota bacterium]